MIKEGSERPEKSKMITTKASCSDKAVALAPCSYHDDDNNPLQPGEDSSRRQCKSKAVIMASLYFLRASSMWLSPPDFSNDSGVFLASTRSPKEAKPHTAAASLGTPAWPRQHFFYLAANGNDDKAATSIC